MSLVSFPISRLECWWALGSRGRVMGDLRFSVILAPGGWPGRTVSSKVKATSYNMGLIEGSLRLIK